jgi:hypothetical protein
MHGLACSYCSEIYYVYRKRDISFSNMLTGKFINWMFVKWEIDISYFETTGLQTQQLIHYS